MRKKAIEEAYGGEEKDALVARGALGVRICELVDTEQLFDRFFIKLTKIIDNAYNSTVQY